ncbi:helix-turn-helix domain-containing protein [Aquimarina sediminis]|uniref:helix-turn-helix domain-containing protein n=1 Tax=Aquimarina sediminis TaxID=2070536 RepID=UPI000CA03BB8|nr:helix-turn-helix domain-containing protein [Aquimarina sediminis]
MKIDYNLVSQLEILGVLQGVILGAIIIIGKNNGNRSIIYLGLMIIAYSLDFLSGILDDMSITNIYPKLKLLPFSFTWIIFPLLYVYVQKFSIFKNQKISYWVLYPGLVSVVINIILFFFPVSKKNIFSDSNWYIIYDLIGFLYSLFIGFLTLKLIIKQKRELKDQFYNTESSELRWIYWFVIVSLGYIFLSLFLVLILFSLLLKNDNITSIVFSSVDVILLYWLTIHGLKYKYFNSATKNFFIYNKILLRKSISIKYKKEFESLIFQLDNYLLQTEAFMSPSFSISKAAIALNVHTRKISLAINTVGQQNFKSFVNNYRIEKSKDLIKNNSIREFSIEGIGNEVGFKSKSAFYKEFKRRTNSTPLQYYKSLSKNK